MHRNQQVVDIKLRVLLNIDSLYTLYSLEYEYEKELGKKRFAAAPGLLTDVIGGYCS